MPSSFRTVAPTSSWSPVSAVPKSVLKAVATSPAWSRITWNAGISTLTKVSLTASAASRRSRSHLLETDSSGACDRMLTRSTMIDDRLDASCCRTALIRSELVARAFRIASVAWMMAGATRVANLLAYCSKRKPDEGQFIGGPSGNGGRLIGGRQPQGLDLLLVLLDALRAQIEKRDQLRTNPLAEELDRQLGLLCAILHAGKLGGNRPEGIDGQDLLAGFQPDVLQDARQCPGTLGQFGRLASPLANDLAIVAEARDDLDGAA